MNKAELVEALTARLGDKRSATAALDAVLTEIQHAVTKGDKVSLTGFGVFEKRARGARVARNPRTGEAVKVKKTSVPAFRAGAGFKEMVASGKVPKVAKTAAKKTAAAKTTTAKAAAAKTTTARKTAPAKSTAAKSTTRPAAAKKTATAKTATAKKTTATKSAAKATTARKTVAKKAPAKKAVKR